MCFNKVGNPPKNWLFPRSQNCGTMKKQMDKSVYDGNKNRKQQIEIGRKNEWI